MDKDLIIGQDQTLETEGAPDNKEGAFSVEEGFKKLDVLLERLQDPAVSLEDAFAAYTEGMELVKQCTARIDLIEKKVEILNKEGETDGF